MATFQITPPNQFNFSQPDKWPKWICRFKRFREASRLNTKEEVSQINTSMYCMGDQADDILCSLNLTADRAGRYFDIIEKSDY